MLYAFFARFYQFLPKYTLGVRDCQQRTATVFVSYNPFYCMNSELSVTEIGCFCSLGDLFCVYTGNFVTSSFGNT